MRYTACAHNLRFDLGRAKWLEDMRKSTEARVVFYSEGGNAKVRAALRENAEINERGLYMPDTTGNHIGWDPEMFTRIPKQHGVVEVHAKHPHRRMNPAKDFSWVGLRRNGLDGKTLLAVCVHPNAGYTTPGGREGTEQNIEYNQWNDWGAMQYWLDIVSFCTAQMSLEIWDDILVGGDYNAPMGPTKDDRADDEWWYPYRLFGAIALPDESGHIDHLILTRDSESKGGKITRKSGFTDHPIVFRQMS